MKTKFIEKESYLHKFAKEQLARWLSEDIDKPNDLWNFSSIKFYEEKLDKEMEIAARRGFIQTEYPITDCFPSLIDECACSLPSEISIVCNKSRTSGINPCLKCICLNKKIRYVCDIVVEHKGIICTIIEIINKNPLENKKIDFLKEHGVMQLLTVDARHILGQIGKPARLFVEEL